MARVAATMSGIWKTIFVDVSVISVHYIWFFDALKKAIKMPKVAMGQQVTKSTRMQWQTYWSKLAAWCSANYSVRQ